MGRGGTPDLPTTLEWKISAGIHCAEDFSNRPPAPDGSKLLGTLAISLTWLGGTGGTRWAGGAGYHPHVSVSYPCSSTSVVAQGMELCMHKSAHVPLHMTDCGNSA